MLGCLGTTCEAKSCKRKRDILQCTFDLEEAHLALLYFHGYHRLAHALSSSSPFFLLPIYSILQGVVLKYSEPEEARKPKLHWRLYPFKGDQEMRMRNAELLIITWQLRNACTFCLRLGR